MLVTMALSNNRAKNKVPKPEISNTTRSSRSNRMNVVCTQMYWIGYADDLVLAFESTDDLEKAINLLK